MKKRIRQFRDVWKQLREVDDRAGGLILLGGTIGLLLGVGLGFAIPFFPLWLLPAFALLFAALGALVVFNRRVQKAQYGAIEGRPGAAAAVLSAMRGQFFVTPTVAVNAKQDMVHRVVGPCGVVLVGEGSSQRVKGLIAKERKRLQRVVGDTAITALVVGDDDDQISLNKLQATITRLPRALKKGEVPKLERKLRPLDKGAPIPKGIDPMAVANRKRPKPR